MPVPGRRSIAGAEKLAQAKIGGVRVRREQMAAAPSTFTRTMVAGARTHHGRSRPVCWATRPLTMGPYSPYVAAWTTQ